MCDFLTMGWRHLLAPMVSGPMSLVHSGTLLLVAFVAGFGGWLRRKVLFLLLWLVPCGTDFLRPWSLCHGLHTVAGLGYSKTSPHPARLACKRFCILLMPRMLPEDEIPSKSCSESYNSLCYSIPELVKEKNKIIPF